LTDYLFRDDAAIRYSLVIVNVVGMTLALAFFASGLGAYRKTLESRDRWCRSLRIRAAPSVQRVP
jgi:hypothetical protein